MLTYLDTVWHRDGGNMSWRCGLIENGVLFHPDGTIAPCCMIDNDYRKPVSELFNDPFADIRTGKPEPVCKSCIDAEKNNLESMRENFKPYDDRSYRYLDVRNTNLCNMKCRMCGPEYSSLFNKELGNKDFIIKQDIEQYLEKIVNNKLEYIYYTGGEPLLNPDHWLLLELLIEKGYSKNIVISYNSNGTVTKFKDKNIIDIWKQFKHVKLMLSIDAVGEEFDILRHGGKWDKVKQNLEIMKHWPIETTIAVTVSLLNIWTLKNLMQELQDFNIKLNNLYYPPHLSLNAIDERYKQQAIDCLDELKNYHHDHHLLDHLIQYTTDNYNCNLFKDTILHILLLDKKRNENLFDRLPFTDYSIINI